MTKHARRAALATALASAALTAPASAAVVRGSYHVDIRDDFGSVSIEDPDGGRNDLRVTRRGRRLLIRERGPDTLRETGNCRKEKRRLVSCPPRDSDALFAELGRGDDALRVDTDTAFPGGYLDGGRGDDLLEANDRGYQLRGESGHDTLVGGRRGDRMYGGRGRDRLHGHGGRDVLEGDFDDPFDDLLDGGDGLDRATWEERETGIRVDLAKHRARGRGERDVVRSIEAVSGGRGDDVLLGSAGPDRLRGRGGRDVMLGRAGNDLIDAGSDNRPDHSRDHVGCGSGSDEVDGAWVQRPKKGRRTDAVPQSCERHFFGGGVPVPRLTLGARKVTVVVGCWFEPRCRGRVTVSSRGTVLGRSERRTRKKRVTLVVKLDEPLRRGPPLDVEFEGATNHGSGWQPTYTAVRLRRPR